MEQQFDLPQLQTDPETFRRVWSRVMPDQENSPLVVVSQPQPAPAQSRAESTPGTPPPAPAPDRPRPPQTGAQACTEAPLCLGEAARPHAQELQQLMDRAREGAETGQALSRRAGNWSRSLAALASDHRRALRQLSAAYFLITGQRHRPAQPALSLNPSLPLALRDQFVWEQRWERDCRRAAEGCSDPCLGELYQELARDGTLHAAVIRSLLEQM